VMSAVRAIKLRVDSHKGCGATLISVRRQRPDVARTSYGTSISGRARRVADLSGVAI